ncbi:MAG: hypothetical protein ABIZ80_11670 [Bryobacteraceae bacterium]
MHAPKLFSLFVIVAFAARASAMNCDVSGYKEQAGLSAAMKDGALEVSWLGTAGAQLRAVFAIDGADPVIRELAVRKSGGAWAAIGRDLKPEFQVTTGVRRISEQQLAPLRELGLMSPAILEKEKWKVFWDAPLSVPGVKGTNPGLPRKSEEIRRATAAYQATGCGVKTDGARLEVSFPGVTIGMFSGSLVFTVYRGTSLLRQEVIAKTEEQSVAYKYNAGLKGFRTGSAPRVVWRDTSSSWQKYEFGGAVNRDAVALRARNRVAIVEGAQGSLAVFPPPHKFFFAREIELNLGYVWYRKDTDGSFSVGVRHGDREESYRPYGVSDEQFDKRVKQGRRFAQANFALYNAPPGTWQRMAVYYYLSPEKARATQAAVMAFTHEDSYKPLPGYQVAVSHFHTHFNEMLSDAGSIDVQPSWLAVFRSLGINIAMMSDFHGDGHAKDAGPLRFKDQQTYFDGCRRHSDTEFLIVPGEEPDAYFGGHYTMVFPKPVFWSHVRKAGQQFEETHPEHGKVYHVGSKEEELDMLRREGGLVWQAHPRTKGSSGYPEAIRETEHFRSDRYLGASYQSLPADLSHKRLCEERCFGVLDDMNNWGAPKFMFAEGDTYAKYPDDDTYSHLIVNYVKLAKLPKFDEGWQPVSKAIRDGEFFVTSGEVLLKKVAVEGSGSQRTMVADVEWTFPLDFVELVWGDGEKTERKEISATGQAPFGSHRFRIPFDAAGKKWVRFAAWDSAGNGAFAQPVHLN